MKGGASPCLLFSQRSSMFIRGYYLTAYRDACCDNCYLTTFTMQSFVVLIVPSFDSPSMKGWDIGEKL